MSRVVDPITNTRFPARDPLRIVRSAAADRVGLVTAAPLFSLTAVDASRIVAGIATRHDVLDPESSQSLLCKRLSNLGGEF